MTSPLIEGMKTGTGRRAVRLHNIEGAQLCYMS